MGSWVTPSDAADALRTGTGRGVRIAVLDSGIETSHPALTKVAWSDDIAVVEAGFQLETIAGAGEDVFGHGTAVAGIIHRIAPEAEIGSIRVLGSSLEARTAIVQEGALRAIEAGYNILNCSFGCMIPDHVLRYKQWVDRAYARGRHVVAACSNTRSDRQEWPAGFTSVIGVTMARSRDHETFFHRPGSLIEFAAAGLDVEVPWSGGMTKSVIGTSFAAPHLTGMLARLLGAFPDLHPLEAKSLLRRSANPWVESLSAPG